MSGILSAMMGGAGPIITLQNETITGSAAAPASPVTATYSLQSDGDIVEDENGGGLVDIGDWIVPRAAAGSNWEVFVSAVPGANISAGSDALGTWLSLGTTRAWGVQRVGGVAGTNTETLTVQIRKASTGIVKDTASITLNATVT